MICTRKPPGARTQNGGSVDNEAIPLVYGAVL
jgi:hypothetical protein